MSGLSCSACPSPLAACELRPVERAAHIDHRAVLLGAVGAGAVEVLERQAQRIHETVAARAHRLRAMRLQADARGGLIGVVGREIDRAEIHIRRRIRHLLAHEDFADRPATQRGRGAARMGVQGEKAHLGQDARVPGVGRQFRALPTRCGWRQAVCRPGRAHA